MDCKLCEGTGFVKGTLIICPCRFNDPRIIVNISLPVNKMLINK